jgi:putative phage-type endonuclease
MIMTTSPDNSREEWLEARRSGIGGSDVAAICGLDPWRTVTDVYDEKLGVAGDKPPTAPMLRGTYLEPVAADLYAERTGRALRRQPLRRHADYPWMIGNVDRQILAGTAGITETGILEVKCPGVRTFAKVKAHGMPENYILQLQHYLAVYGYSWGSFALFSAENWELVHFDIEADAAIRDRLIEIEHDFWHDHVLAEVRPEPAPVALPKLPEVSGEVVTRDDPEWTDAIAMLAEAQDLKAGAEELHLAAKSRIQERAGSHGVYEGAGARIYWREMAGRRTFDKKALAAARPLDRQALIGILIEKAGLTEAQAASVADTCALDLDAFEKQGNPFAEFRTYFLTGED